MADAGRSDLHTRSTRTVDSGLAASWPPPALSRLIHEGDRHLWDVVVTPGHLEDHGDPLDLGAYSVGAFVGEPPTSPVVLTSASRVKS